MNVGVMSNKLVLKLILVTMIRGCLATTTELNLQQLDSYIKMSGHKQVNAPHCCYVVDCIYSLNTCTSKCRII